MEEDREVLRFTELNVGILAGHPGSLQGGGVGTVGMRGEGKDRGRAGGRGGQEGAMCIAYQTVGNYGLGRTRLWGTAPC